MRAVEKNISFPDIELEAIQAVYFIGIGGIGMSALARYFNRTGKKVFGYDHTATQLTQKLEAEGIHIHFEDQVTLIPSEFTDIYQKNALVIYTPAIPLAHKELNYFKSKGYNLLKRSQALGVITGNTHGLAVAGTHGKTTTSCILAHIIHAYGEPLSAFLGGIASNFDSNFVHEEGAKLTVVEADEYDRSFLTLHPIGAIITSTDADHLDIYGEAGELLKSFRMFAEQVSSVLLLHEDISEGLTENKALQRSPEKILTYGWNTEADYQITSRVLKEGSYVMDIKTPHGELLNIVFPMAGKHNTENALAALALAAESGLDINKLAEGLASFKGIKRRFETLVNTSDHIYIDDYAHHPTELNAAISATKELYPNKKLTGIFQPHLFSRTKDFADEFAASLSKLDQVILLDIYPARERPLEGVTSGWLLEKISTQKKLLSKEETLHWVKSQKPELLMTLGAGDIDQLVTPIKQALS
jgi:UDP-N-acetylmuramate--alanine ligase